MLLPGQHRGGHEAKDGNQCETNFLGHAFLGKVLGEKLLGVGPHFFREHMAGVFLYEGGEVPGGSGLCVGLGDFFDTCTCLLDGCAAIIFTEIQVQCARGDERGDIGRVAVLVNTGDEVGETM